jgi:hypothetical protein
MPYTVKAFQPTPNPNALKCILDRKISDRPRSYFKPDEAAGDPLASRLFALEGVTNLLINADWITVNKAAAADWKSIKAGVERILRETE